MVEIQQNYSSLIPLKLGDFPHIDRETSVHIKLKGIVNPNIHYN